MQALGDPGEVGHETKLFVRAHAGGLLESARDHVLSGEVRGGGVEVPTLTPLHYDAIHRFSALGGLRIGDVDIDAVSSDAGDVADRFGNPVPSGGNDPWNGGQGGSGRRSDGDGVTGGWGSGIDGGPAAPTLARPSSDRDVDFTGAIHGHEARIFSRIVF